MAEFTELTCVNCPMWLEKEEVCGFRLPFNPDFAEVEKDVMEWAEENPEKSDLFEWVYPSWTEWQKAVSPDAPAYIKPCAFSSPQKLGCDSSTCRTCAGKPIPAVIAEKLGIKPIGRERKA